MTQEEMKSLGIVKKKGKSGTRFLLRDKDLLGKERYVTLKITDKSSKKEISEEIEKARILLKKDTKGIKKLILAWHEARGHAHKTRLTADHSLKRITLDDESDRAACIDLACDVSLKATSRQLMLRYIRSFFAWINSIGIRHPDPTASVCVKAARVPRKRVLTDDEISHLLKETEKDYDARLILMLMLHTGCRVSTACLFEPNAWDEKTKTVSLFNKKAGRPYTYKIPIVDPVLVEMLPKGYMGSPFKASSRLYKKMHQMGPDKTGEFISPHTVRHTWATRAIQSGIPIEIISHMLDHSSISITLAVYARHSEKQLLDAANIVSNIIPTTIKTDINS